MPSRRASWVLAALAVTASFGSCVLDPVTYDERPCPCPPESEGFTCDEQLKKCVRTDAINETTTGTATAASSTGAGGAGTTTTATTTGEGGGPLCTPTVTPADVRIDWTTPNAAFFRWSQPENPGEIGFYQIVLGLSKEAVENHDDSVRVFDQATNPELGSLHLDKATDSEAIQSVLIVDLDPNTDYWGRLIATDSGGCEYKSPVIRVPTLPKPPETANHEVVFFRDSELPNHAPPALTTSLGCGVDRSSCINCASDCAGTYQNIQLAYATPASTFVESGISPNDVANFAYIEFSLAIDGCRPEGRWGSFYVTIRSSVDGTNTNFRIEPFVYVMRPELRTYQVRLSGLTGTNQKGLATALTQTDLVTNGLYEFTFGGDFSGCSAVRIDNLTLRW